MTDKTKEIFKFQNFMEVDAWPTTMNGGVLRVIVPETPNMPTTLSPTLKIIADGDTRKVRIETDDYTATLQAAQFWDEMTQLAEAYSAGDIKKAIEARYKAVTASYSVLLTDTLTQRLLDEYKDGGMNLNSQFGEDEILLGKPAISCRPSTLYVLGGVLYVAGEDLDGNEHSDYVKRLFPSDIEKLTVIFERPIDIE